MLPFSWMSPRWSSLRDGTWLDPARLRRVGFFLGLAYLASWGYALCGRGNLDPGGRPVGSDFSFFYGVSWAVEHGASVPSLYDPDVFNRAIGAFTGGWTYYWFYPPTAVFVFRPLAALPYLPALAAWVLMGVAVYVALTQAILPRRWALAACVLSPAVYVATIHGQNSLLIASLIGGGLVSLPRAPCLAGLLFALASFKPQFGVLLPLALVAGRYWRTLVVAVLFTLMLAVLAGAVFGFESWRSFFDAQRLAGALLEKQGVPYFKLASVFSAIRLSGGSYRTAWVAQGAFAAAAVVWTTLLWCRSTSLDLKVAGTVVATLLAIPYFYDYDLPLLGVGLAFWVRAAGGTRWLPWEKTLVFALWMLPLVARPFAQWTHVGLTPPLLVLSAVAIALRERILLEMRPDR
jgi:alpha-1,2-mannosyltransferase